MGVRFDEGAECVIDNYMEQLRERERERYGIAERERDGMSSRSVSLTERDGMGSRRLILKSPRGKNFPRKWTGKPGKTSFKNSSFN